MEKYFIINTEINRPLSKFDSNYNSEAFEFPTINSAEEFISKSDLPNKNCLKVMTWKEFQDSLN
ncbi:hypothetical protein [Clostridium perfringens]|uniref:hypothetical protein n=1 Tax=Clostridium perfringens TaxID=1502 RepID=UPI00321A758D